MNNITSRYGPDVRMKAASRIWRMAGCALAFGLALGTTGQAIAADFSVPLEAGVACPFAITIEGSGAPNRVFRDFTDVNGNPVRTLQAGRGYNLTFINPLNGSRYHMTPSGGSVNNTRINPDGTQTTTLSGHNVLILFPTDVPAGPTTTLYVGRVVYTTDRNAVFTIVSVNGKQPIDICAALSG